uniref:C2H2-type domain-containing protein n=1 Tax=Rhabditophanes sp. KR3021 TaxID=114890 RepID=A0AC35U9Q5_9BILA
MKMIANRTTLTREKIKCFVCPDSFLDCDLIPHVVSHLNIKPYECGACNYNTHHLSSLENHCYKKNHALNVSLEPTVKATIMDILMTITYCINGNGPDGFIEGWKNIAYPNITGNNIFLKRRQTDYGFMRNKLARHEPTRYKSPGNTLTRNEAPVSFQPRTYQIITNFETIIELPNSPSDLFESPNVLCVDTSILAGSSNAVFGNTSVGIQAINPSSTSNVGAVASNMSIEDQMKQKIVIVKIHR